jgi:hypothetical protein
LLAAPEVEVERLTKQGLRRFDARVAVVSMQAVGAQDAPLTSAAADCAILTGVVRHVTPSVRPDDVLAALRRVADLVPPVPPRVTRLAQGPLNPVTATVGDPFAPDRSA